MNKQKGLLQESITLFVIFSLLSIGFTPLIPAKEETQEYTLMVPNIFGIKKQQISLTSEQSGKLDSIFDDLQEQLQDADSVQETKLLYKRAIDTFVDSGLLSKSDAFLTKKLLFSDIVDKFYSVLDKRLCLDSDIENRNCYISGESTYSIFFRPILWRIWPIKNGLFRLLFSNFFFSHYVYFADISFGLESIIDQETSITWSSGWVWTNNTFGNKSVDGQFRGSLSKIALLPFHLDCLHCFLGVYFFIGIGYHSRSGSTNISFIGRSYKVDIIEK